MSLALDDLIDPSWIYIKERGNAVLELSLSEEIPHLDCVIEGEASTRCFALFHWAISFEIAAEGLDFVREREQKVHVITTAQPSTAGYFPKPGGAPTLPGFTFGRITKGPVTLCRMLVGVESASC